MESKECWYCGAPFVPDNEAQIYCSAECYEADNEYSPPFNFHYKRKCLTCGEFFVPKKPNSRYCCKKCRLVNQNKVLKEKRSKERALKPAKNAKCAYCGKEFEIKQAWRKFCSIECSIAWRDIYQKERYKKIRAEKLAKKVETQNRQVEGEVDTLANGKPIINMQRGANNTHYAPEAVRYLYKKGKPTKPPKRKSTLDQITKEAAECGLSYGKYRAYLNMGKTYEELKAAFEKTLSIKAL